MLWNIRLPTCRHTSRICASLSLYYPMSRHLSFLLSGRKSPLLSRINFIPFPFISYNCFIPELDHFLIHSHSLIQYTIFSVWIEMCINPPSLGAPWEKGLCPSQFFLQHQAQRFPCNPYPAKVLSFYGLFLGHLTFPSLKWWHISGLKNFCPNYILPHFIILLKMSHFSDRFHWDQWEFSCRGIGLVTTSITQVSVKGWSSEL
jgi:hypothetical protein